MLAARKRQEEESLAKMADSEEKRKAELATVEQELEELRQRQAERRAAREVEEREFAERRRADEQRRREEEVEATNIFKENCYAKNFLRKLASSVSTPSAISVLRIRRSVKIW